MSTIPNMVQALVSNDLKNIQNLNNPSPNTTNTQVQKNELQDKKPKFDLEKAGKRFEDIFNQITSVRESSEKDGKVTPQLLDKSLELSKELRGAISDFIDAIAQNPSLITQVSDKWGNLRISEQVMAMVPFFVPLIGGFMIFNPLLLGLGVALSTVSVSLSWILNDHHNKNAGVLNLMKNGVLKISDMLIFMIGIQAEQLKELTSSVAELKKQNEIFSSEVRNLRKTREELRAEILEMAKNNQELHTEVRGLAEAKLNIEMNITRLNEQLGTMNDQNGQLSQEILQLKDTHQLIKTQLEKKAKELETSVSRLYEANCSLGDEVEVMRMQNNMINEMLTRMRTFNTLDEEAKKVFATKIKEFLDSNEKNKEFFMSCNKEYQFTLNEMKMTKEQFSTLAEEFVKLQKEYKELLEENKKDMRENRETHKSEMSSMYNSLISISKEVEKDLKRKNQVQGVGPNGFFPPAGNQGNPPHNPQPPGLLL